MAGRLVSRASRARGVLMRAPMRANFPEEIYSEGRESGPTDKRVELEAEKAKSKVAKAVGDGHVPPVAPSSTKKVGGPARISEADRAMFREIEPFKWRDLALDRDARVPKMRELVQFLLRRFDAEDFDEVTFNEMAHCFATEEPGKNADEKNWAGLVKALDSLARKEFKAETGRTPPKPTLAKEPLQVYEGELLGTDEP